MINSNRAYEMLGSGLTKARKLLTELKHHEPRILVSIIDRKKASILNDAFYILTSIIDKWQGESDYLLAENFIAYKDYNTVAKKLDKDRSLMWKREKTLNMASYFAIKNIIE
jgi:hypothetical protein